MVESREDEHIPLDRPLSQREQFDYFERIVEMMTDRYTDAMERIAKHHRRMLYVLMFVVLLNELLSKL